jgi:hypothetical protein
MRKMNEMEMLGGSVTVFAVKLDGGKDFPLVTPELKEVKTQRTGGTTATTSYTDGEKEWSKDQLGYNINGRFVQKVSKTDKVVRYVLKEKTDYAGNFLQDSTYVVEADAVAEEKLRELGIYDDKVMDFTYKKTDGYMKFHRAILSSFAGVLFMDTAEKPAFKSDIAAQVKAERMVKGALLAALAGKQEIVVKASEIEVTI